MTEIPKQLTQSLREKQQGLSQQEAFIELLCFS